MNWLVVKLFITAQYTQKFAPGSLQQHWYYAEKLQSDKMSGSEWGWMHESIRGWDGVGDNVCRNGVELGKILKF